MPRAVAVVPRLVCALCVVVLCGVGVFDARAERITAGRTPRGYAPAIGVAHNAVLLHLEQQTAAYLRRVRIITDRLDIVRLLGP